MEAAGARLQVADAELKLAEQNFARRSELYEEKAIAREAFDLASERLEAARAMRQVRANELRLLELGTREAELEAARARVDGAREAYELAKSGYREEVIEQAEASRDAAAASVRVIDAQLEELQIRAPVNGIVEAYNLQPGDLVPAGAPVLSLLDDRRLWVRAFVPENRAGLNVG